MLSTLLIDTSDWRSFGCRLVAVVDVFRSVNERGISASLVFCSEVCVTAICAFRSPFCPIVD